MKKMNYRITVNINDSTMKLGFRGVMPEEYKEKKVRIQAIFMQRKVERRFPMEVSVDLNHPETQIWGDAEIELPYVFYNPPRHKVSVTFAIWFGMEEVILNDQPFPVQKELFARSDRVLRRNVGKFALGCAALPVLAVKNYTKEKNKSLALKKSNQSIYDFSGYSFSPRQRKTDYFSLKYKKFAQDTDVVANRILFLSERLPEKGGNLQRIKEYFEADSSVELNEFILTKTVDALSKKELKECAQLCAQARVIILEDFYPQLHSVKLRPETKVVQLWHACGTFKTFGYSRLGKQGGAPQSSMNHRNYDFVSVSSQNVCDLYAEAFAVSPAKVKALGVPRTDALFDDAYKEKVKNEIYQKYPQLKDKKVVLFAPTFRGDGNKDAYYPADAFDVNSFMKILDEKEEGKQETVCIIKHHPFVSQPIEVDAVYKDRVLDLTGRDHINDLMLVTDLLITDYSSSVFEAAILDIPILFYAFDKAEYIAQRDFYCDYDDFAPGYVEETFEGMTQCASDILSGKSIGSVENMSIIIKKLQFSKDFLSALDGKSTQRIADYIKENML